MKKIGDFLFVEQCFTDTEETKTAVVNINYEEEWQSIK